MAVGFAIWAPVGDADAESLTTPQAEGLNASWMQYLPPPAQNPVICVIDGGVDLTPDTESIVMQRLTVMDNGELDDVADGDGHGTLIASLIAAPRNGLGTVGLWPYARIVSVRATDDIGNFTWSAYALAMAKCQRIAGLVAINLSLGGPEGPDQPHYDIFLGRVRTLLAAGVSIVSSTGNERGAVNYPAAVPGVVAVAGNDKGGVLCGFSSRRTDVLSAPGCPVATSGRAGTEVSAQGTSFAGPLAATVMASIRAYRSDLSRQQVEDLVVQTAHPQADGSRSIDVRAAYRAADLVDAVNQAEAIQAAGSRRMSLSAGRAWVAIPLLRWVQVRRSEVVIRLRRPYPKGSLILLGRRARQVNSTTIRAPRSLRTWKLGLVALDDLGTGRRSRPREIFIRGAASAPRPSSRLIR